MAASFAASLLDELMGRNRNADPRNKTQELHWSDPEVCRHYLCGFCPHELFTNTRSDLGQCTKIHDDELIKKYNASSRYLKMGYEEEFLMYLQELIGEIERKIRRGHQRLALNQAQAASVGPIGIHSEKLRVLSERITELVEQAEKMGCEGRVEEAQGVLKLCDQLKEERNALQESAANQLTPKEMEVCPVCGAFLVVGDAPQRVEEHITGKQHAGYAKVRETIESLKKRLRGEDPEREARLKREREERDREKERERMEKDRLEKVQPDKEPVKNDVDRKERSGSRSSRQRSRSRSRHDSRRRSRSRSHGRQRHSRSRDDDRSKRSRSKERRHRSRDEDRSRDSRRSHNGSRERDGRGGYGDSR